jgi:hypothetical protein
LKDLIQTEVDTPDGVGLLEQIYVTELGHVMARIYYRKKGIWINKKITSLDSFLNGSGISAKDYEYKVKKFKGRRLYKVNTYG